MAIKRIASSYVYYYNHKYSRDGHLFRERFKSEPVNDMAYFVTLLRYIHQNPVKAGDVPTTYADATALERDFGFTPKITLREELRKFAEWYKEFYGHK
jgi:nucleoside-diphosphate-sugar epimerase